MCLYVRLEIFCWVIAIQPVIISREEIKGTPYAAMILILLILIYIFYLLFLFKEVPSTFLIILVGGEEFLSFLI